MKICEVQKVLLKYTQSELANQINYVIVHTQVIGTTVLHLNNYKEFSQFKNPHHAIQCNKGDFNMNIGRRI